MKLRKILILSLVCMLVMMYLGADGVASAQETKVVSMEELARKPLDLAALEFWSTQGVARVTQSLSIELSPTSGGTINDSFSLAVNDTISYDCTYTPKSASVDFGFIAPDGYFYYENSTTGSINKTFRVSQRGSYTLAIYNNSSNTVTVTGTVNY